MSASSPVWAIYDLSLPGRGEGLAKDLSELRATGAVIMVAGQFSTQADVFLDGVEIEQQWFQQERWRATLEALRTELSSAVDGEVFLRAARRAVLLASRSQNATAPGLVFGAGVAESLVAWLMTRLIGSAYVASLQDDTHWTTKLVSQIRGDARAVREGSLTQCLNG